jgi:hypothetical protein
VGGLKLKIDKSWCVFRVFCGYIKEVESKPGPNSWGSKMTFANPMAEFSNGGGEMRLNTISNIV